MSDLPPFSGDDPTCPKCGFVGASTEYRPCGQTMRWGADITSFGSERLHRECRRCDYAWDEATVEQPKEAEPLRDDGSCGCCGALPTECVCPGECVCPCPPGKDRNW